MERIVETLLPPPFIFFGLKFQILLLIYGLLLEVLVGSVHKLGHHPLGHPSGVTELFQLNAS